MKYYSDDCISRRIATVSRELAREMRGDLTLESVEGVRSTFSLTVPLTLEQRH